MALVLTEEQDMLKTSARDFLKEKAPVATLRKLRDDKDPQGYNSKVWQEMVEAGWSSLIIPEQYGGLGYGFVGLGQVLEETGRTLTASPLVSTALIGASTLILAGSQEQKETLLPQITEGKLILAMALEETKQHNPSHIQMVAEDEGDKYLLNGKKYFVLDGHIANKFIVVARIQGGNNDGLSLFLVDSNAEGVSITRQTMMDSRNAATVSFKNVEVPASDVIGDEGKGFEVFEKVLDIARIGLSAEMLGTVTEAFERTVAYLKQRQQFGVPIGVFQGLQHRAAFMYGEVELCKSLVIKALQAVDNNDANLARTASLTKAKLGETIKLVTNEAVQMFGGIGMTDDEEIGFFLKRARVAQHTFGDSNYHLNRFARLNDF